jgi:adenylosuccinate lyase
LLKLTERGLERKTAYEAVQRAAMKTWKGTESLLENLKAEEEITAKITPDELGALCSLNHHLRWVDDTFRRLGL